MPWIGLFVADFTFRAVFYAGCAMANADNERPAQWGVLQSPLAMVVVALLAILGIRSPSSPNNGAKGVPVSKADDASASKDKDKKIPEENLEPPPWELLNDYFLIPASRWPSVTEPGGHAERDESPWPDVLKTSQHDSKLAHDGLKRKRLIECASQVVPRIDCLIATVADPIDSRFQHIFDASIDAIQRGIGGHGYDLDRFSLLWTEELKDLAKGKSSESISRRSRLEPSAMLFRRNLFAMDNTPSDTWNLSGNTNSLLMVLLVGETPTTGVHKSALAEALDFVSLCHSHPCHQGGLGIAVDGKPSSSIRIKILGPEFSGSASSLRQGIVDWWRQRSKDGVNRIAGHEVEILSGSATSDSVHTILNHFESSDERSWLSMRFNATVLPDSTTRIELLRHLINTRGIPADKIVLLAERGTAYGRTNDVKRNVNDKKDGKGHDTGNTQFPKNLKAWHELHDSLLAPIEARADNGSKTVVHQKRIEFARSMERTLRERVLDDSLSDKKASGHVKRLETDSWCRRMWFLAGRRSQFGHLLDSKEVAFDQLRRIREFSYPLGLSRIRSEFEKSDAYRNEGGKNGQVVTKRNVELRLGNVQHSIDTVPIYSDVTTPAVDISLEQLLSTIKRDDIRAVGLVGTDVLDKLFLAQQLRAHAPDLLLFTQEYDVFYMHADYAGYLNGMVLVSSYPFNPRGRGWMAHDTKYRDYVFATDTAQGVFNATVALLNMQFRNLKSYRPVDMLNYEPPFSQGRDSGTAKRTFGPSVWLTMVGDTGLLPLDVVSIHEGKHEGAIAYVHQPSIPRAADSKGEVKELRPSLLFVHVPPFLPLFLFLVAASLGLAVLFVIHGLSDRQRRSGVWRMAVRFAPWLALGGWQWRAARHRPRRIAGLELHRAKRLWAPRSMRSLFLAGLLWCVAVASVAMAAPRLAAIRFDLLSMSGHLDVQNSWGLEGAVALVATLLVILAAIVVAIRRFLVVAPGFVATASLSLVVGAILVGGGVVVWLMLDDVRAASFAERAGALGSGLSPVMPVLALLAALGCWCLCHLRREYFLRVFRLSNPFPNHRVAEDGKAGGESDQGSHLASNLVGFGHRFHELNAWLKGKPRLPRAAGDWVMGLVFSIWMVYTLAFGWTGSAEGRLFDIGFRLLLGVCLVAYFSLLIRIRAVAGLFERLLRRLAQHPMVFSFTRVPERLASKVSGQLFAASPHPGDLEFSVRCLNRLVQESREDATVVKAASEGPSESREEFPARVTKFAEGEIDIRRFDRRLAAIFGRDRAHQIEALFFANRLFGDLTLVSREHIVPKLERYWSQIEVLRDRGRSDNDDSGKGREKSWTWEREAEVFVAMQWMNLIRQVFTHLQNLMMFLIAMLLCILISLQIYPFQPRNGLLTFWFGLMAWTVLSIVIAIVKFNRDEVLSRICQTVPNQFTFDRSLVVPFLSYVVAPITGILLVWFPALGRVLFGWFGTIGAWPGV